MSRLALPLLAVLVTVPCLAQDREEAPAPEPQYLLKSALRSGDRYTGTNGVVSKIKTTVRQGQDETSSYSEHEHKERFVDEVTRASNAGEIEIDRMFLTLFSKVRRGENDRPRVDRSPLAGQKVTITERVRHRDVKSNDKPVDGRVRRTIGMELDWRDIFPREAVRVGDTWKADADALARRLGAYLDSGTRSTMHVKLEEVADGKARLYVDWEIQGMRDRQLFTKVTMAGDVLFDMDLRRVVSADLQGTMIVRGAVITESTPKIVKGEGPVSLKTTLKPAPVSAAAPAEDEDGE